MRNFLVFGFAILLGSYSLQAAPVIYNLPISGISAYDNTVTATGAALSVIPIVLGQSTYNYGNNNTVTVTRPNSNTPFGANVASYSSNGIALSGASWGISPFTTGGELIPGQYSGITFNFSSPINSFGFEVGDWATCCTTNVRPANIQNTYGVPATGSGLWIAFSGGAFTLPANALSSADNPGIGASNSFTNFIGAIDSSSSFSSVTFFGDGFGEYLVAGGSLRIADVPINSVVGAPEPGTYILMGAGLAGLAFLRRRR